MDEMEYNLCDHERCSDIHRSIPFQRKNMLS